jgi:tmRNA-binding protein
MGSTPWQLTATRTIRNYRVNVLMRNQNFLRKIKSFEVEKEWNVGIVLEPSEVKSLRERNGDLSAAFAEFYRHELFIHQLHIPGTCVWPQCAFACN